MQGDMGILLSYDKSIYCPQQLWMMDSLLPNATLIDKEILLSCNQCNTGWQGLLLPIAIQGDRYFTVK